jgi:hypothetical protein
MRKLLLLSVFICTPAFADPINAPRDVQIIASQPQAEASFDPEITGTISNKEKARRARAQHRQQEERPDFADNRPGAARPAAGFSLSDPCDNRNLAISWVRLSADPFAQT